MGWKKLHYDDLRNFILQIILSKIRQTEKKSDTLYESYEYTTCIKKS